MTHADTQDPSNSSESALKNILSILKRASITRTNALHHIGHNHICFHIHHELASIGLVHCYQ